MKSVILALIAIVVFSVNTNAQIIMPKDLTQLYFTFKNYDSGKFDRNTNDLLGVIDKNWVAPNPPTKSGNSETFTWRYVDRQKKLYSETCVFLGVVDKTDATKPDKKSIIYSFIDKKLWKKYKEQMKIMQAEVIQQTESDGGVATFYKVNDLHYALSQYPPGVQADTEAFTVMIF